MVLPDNKKELEIVQSKIVSESEFNFDHMFARPLYSMLSQYDIDRLYKIATSVRLSGNIRKKYTMIDEIMHSRGFNKLSAGTNRVAYTFFEDPSIVVKVAVDKTGIKDNPREFVNQERLKPFCTKVFEVDPYGVVGVFERVTPITSREQYLTVANDVFEMLDLITCKYVLADVGSKYFMNIGVRENFGVVLLDFPYLYEINSPNSLVCTKPEPNSPTGRCEGLIDYDEGFNNLRCNKCGAIYRAQQLGNYLETHQCIMKGEETMANYGVTIIRNGVETKIGVDPVIKADTPYIKVEDKPDTVMGVKDEGAFTRSNGDGFGVSFTRASRVPVSNAPRNTNNNDKKAYSNNIKLPYGKFVRYDESLGKLIYTVLVNGVPKEITIDPKRIPDEILKKVFFNYIVVEEVQTDNIENLKADILKLEEERDIYKSKYEELQKGYSALEDEYGKLFNRYQEETIKEPVKDSVTSAENEVDYIGLMDQNNNVDLGAGFSLVDCAYMSFNEVCKVLGEEAPEDVKNAINKNNVIVFFNADGTFLDDGFGNVYIGTNIQKLTADDLMRS